MKSRWRRVEPVAVWVIYAVGALWIAFLFIAGGAAMYADSTADWLVAAAAADGISPYTDMRDLSVRYDVAFVAPGAIEVGTEAWVHPRTPAALLLLQPLLVFGPEGLYGFVVVASIGILGFVARRHLARLMNRRWPLALLLATVLLISGPMLRSLQFGAWSMLMAALLGAVWVSARRGSDHVAGVLLGVLIAVRLFPGLLMVPMLAARRWRIAVIGFATSLLFNVLGMRILSIPAGDFVEGIASAGDIWISLEANASLIRPLLQFVNAHSLLVVAGLSAVCVAYISRLARKGFGLDQMMAITVVAMLLVSPLSWEHYDVMLFLVVAWMLRPESPKPARVGAALWLWAMTIGFFLRQPWEQAGLLAAGPPSLLGRLLLLVVLLVVARQATHLSVSSTPDPPLAQAK